MQILLICLSSSDDQLELTCFAHMGSVVLTYLTAAHNRLDSTENMRPDLLDVFFLKNSKLRNTSTKHTLKLN